jgi:(1->4)-alpha-D-glucan 1-alpha-D-glucosylmutase
VVGVLEHRVMASAPIATYRLQLTGSFGFREAAKIVPYLAALGISHVYASPILKARAGSTHGYDMIDPTALDPERGGDEGFAALTAALRAAGLGLIVDFVPNHMGVLHADNPWWLDVLEWGPASHHARAFDIDWNALPFRARPGVLIPVLGRPYGEALASGEIVLRYNEREGSFSAWYFEHRLPIGPSSYRAILHAAVRHAGDTDVGRALLALADTQGGFGHPNQDEAPAFKAALAAIDGGAEVILAGLARFTPQAPGGVRALHRLLERQAYRLAHWRLAGTQINYRRFFDINSLAGLRVEDEATFAAVHARIAPLIEQGAIDGLRLDHIDGLADPAGYCARLRDMVARLRPPSEHPFPILVEKILGEGEPLPPFPGVTGTTGYEWLNVITQVLLDARGMPALDALWQEVSGDASSPSPAGGGPPAAVDSDADAEHRLWSEASRGGVTEPRPPHPARRRFASASDPPPAREGKASFAQVLTAAKREVLAKPLASEFNVLARLLARITAGNPATRDFAPERLCAALEAYIVRFPIYRTYVTPEGASAADRALIERVIAAARADAPDADAPLFDFLRDLVTLDLLAPGRVGYGRVRARRFVRKLQQLTGPVMAKSLEDTAFYRFHRLIALNEVGGNPAASALAVDDFHRLMQERAATSPGGLTATATHDTKRGEDARTRILALAELSDEWTALVAQWRAVNAGHLSHAGERRVPSAAHEYMLYQALIGAWPFDGDVERFQAYARKAAREGKQETGWLDPDPAYEEGLARFIAAILDERGFVRSFDALAQRVALLGALNSLSQLALKIAMPGVPDFYQGTEFWDLALVDPDNRRAVNYAAREHALTSPDRATDVRALIETWLDGRIKLALTQRLLAFRRSLGQVFVRGDYRPLTVAGEHRDHVMAFARCHGEDAAIVVVGRRFAALTDGGRHWPRPEAWQGHVELGGFLPAGGDLRPRRIERLPLAVLFDPIPVAMLQGRAPARA